MLGNESFELITTQKIKDNVITVFIPIPRALNIVIMGGRLFILIFFARINHQKPTNTLLGPLG